MPGGGPARVVARLAKQVERALTDVDLSLAQYRLLGNLAAGPSHASTLAERLIVSRPSVTALADGLVQRGLVTRSGAEADRRRVMHVLTDDGRALLDAADAAIERRLASLGSHLSDTDRSRAYRGLSDWGRALDSYRSEVVTKTDVERRVAAPGPRGASAR
jgi:long-chain acyl-CoA synthetase